MILAALLLLQAAPSAEALAAGERLARSGTLAALLPLMAAKDADEMVANNPELTPAEQGELRRTASAMLEKGSARLFAAQARVYAERLPLADLETLAARNTDALAERHRAVLPAAIAAAAATLEGFDFKRETMAAFCAKTGKGCAK